MESSIQTAKQLKLNKLCLARSKQKILHGIDVELPTPGVTVLLGANGAGKSSLLNVLAGISLPDSGQIIRTDLSDSYLMPEPASFYPHLTVLEQLRFVAEQCQTLDDDWISAVMSAWQLEHEAQKLTSQLSLGYRQRLSLAQLAVSDAEVLLLDEPMNGMDPAIMSLFKEQMHIWQQNKTVVMATHIMHEAQDMADWVVVMHQGHVIQSSAYQHQISFNQLYQNAIKHHHQSLPSDHEVAG